MIRELERERELFQRALLNAIFWQNRCVELEEIIEMFCLDAEDASANSNDINFCPRCGKRAYPDTIHTCTPPAFMG